MIKQWTLMAMTAALVCGCSWFKADEPPPLPGERRAALPTDIVAAADEAVAPFSLPAPWVNDSWPQAGGFPGHAMQNLAFRQDVPKEQWAVDIGQGSTKDAPLNAQPLVAGGRVYALDSHGQLSSIDAATGKIVWQLYVGSRDEDDYATGGGVAVEGDSLYVTNGYAEVMALQVGEGQEIWRTRLPAPARAAPSVLDDRVMVGTIDGQMHALNALDGKVLWSYRGLAEGAGVVGAAAPAVNRDLVVAPFSSGEVVALRVENGAVAWSDNLSPPMRLGGIGSLSDIRALPVMDSGLVFALSYGGRLVAIDERTGARVWQRDVGGADAPWVAGENIYVLTKDAQLLALERGTGALRWRLDLPRYDDPVSKKSPILWSGPILAGNRLMVAGTDGVVFDINPATGEVIRDWDVGDTLAVSPVVVGETLYTLARDGELKAWR